jgi:hypothetical protein
MNNAPKDSKYPGLKKVSPKRHNRLLRRITVTSITFILMPRPVLEYKRGRCVIHVFFSMKFIFTCVRQSFALWLGFACAPVFCSTYTGILT